MNIQNEQKRLILAMVFSILVFIAWFYLVVQPAQERALAEYEAARQAALLNGETVDGPRAPEMTIAAPKADPHESLEKALKVAPRLMFETDSVLASVNLQGGRLDDLRLKKYGETVDDDTPVRLLAPSSTEDGYFAETGWVSNDSRLALPSGNTLWKASSESSITWQNGQGLVFERDYKTTDTFAYTFLVTDTVKNTGQYPVILYPYARILRRGGIKGQARYMLHEGPIAYVGDELVEPDYSDLQDGGAQTFSGAKGWTGFVDKYWLVSLMPESQGEIGFSASGEENDRFQASWRGEAVTVEPGESVTVAHRVFAGAKEYDVLTKIRDDMGVRRFDLTVDFGRLYILTKPFFIVLNALGRAFGDLGVTVNFGLAILCLTVLVRGATFPLINASMRSMSRMKQLAPQMKELQERYKDNKQQMQMEIMQMYKREKVNPLGGCLPMVMTIPVFLALYKVLYIAIEMRHAPFWGWIDDLSQADPTSVLTLFGMIPLDLPQALQIGVWPLLYCLTMILQQRLNPKPTDDVQKQIFMMLPIVFTYVMSQLPVGLVIYYSWSNLIGVIQQYAIQKSMGMNPSLLRRPSAEDRDAFYKGKA